MWFSLSNITLPHWWSIAPYLMAFIIKLISYTTKILPSTLRTQFFVLFVVYVRYSWSLCYTRTFSICTHLNTPKSEPKFILKIEQYCIYAQCTMCMFEWVRNILRADESTKFSAKRISMCDYNKIKTFSKYEHRIYHVKYWHSCALAYWLPTHFSLICNLFHYGILSISLRYAAEWTFCVCIH